MFGFKCPKTHVWVELVKLNRKILYHFVSYYGNY